MFRVNALHVSYYTFVSDSGSRPFAHGSVVGRRYGAGSYVLLVMRRPSTNILMLVGVTQSTSATIKVHVYIGLMLGDVEV